MAAEVDPRAPTRTSQTRGPDGPGPETGERIGRYVVERTLGAGGMGVVVEARDPELQRQVAVKLVRADVGDRAYRMRLVRESRAQASLDHPNVVRVYDAGLADGEVFIAMELVVGRSLGVWLRAVRRPWREVLARFVEAGRGLAAAHAAGMVHRDFKPDNVLVRDSDNRVLVTDFGLAIAAGREPRGDATRAPSVGAASVEPIIEPISGDEPTIDSGGESVDAGAIAPATGSIAVTATGVAVGTPPYMAPEQHAGGSVDARADVFSFCASLYEGVCGERPFEVAAARRYDPLAWVEAIERGRLRPPPADRRVPAALRRALVRGLAADPEARWPSMTALLAALEGVLARRRRVLLGLAGAGAAAAIAVSTFAATRSGSAPVIDRCADEATRVDRTWSPDARDRVSRALLATGKAYAPVAVSRATGALDRWSGQWRDVRLSTCHDADRGALAAKDARGVSACLDDALADLGSRVDLLAGGGAAVDHVAEIVDLTAPRNCARVGVDAPPDDPALAAKVAAARDELRAIDTLVSLGQWVAAAPRARALLARARALGWRPVIDDVAFDLAWIDLDVDDSGDAEPLIREVAQSYAARGDDAAAEAATVMLLRLMDHTHRFEGLDFVVSSARAFAVRAHDPRVTVIAEASVGIAYVASGRVGEARTICEAGLRKIDAAGTAFDDGRERFLSCLALTAQAERRWDVQLDYAEQVLQERIRLVGPRHPAVIETLGQVAMAMDGVGRARDALIVQLAAQQLVEEARGLDSGVALSLAQIARIHAHLHEAAEAREAIDRANAMIDRTTAPGDRERNEVLRERSEVLGALGDADGALAALGTLASDAAHDTPGTNDDFASTTQYAQTLQDVHRCAEALPALDGALARGTSFTAPQRLVLSMVKANCQLELHQAADAARELGPAWAAIDPATLAAPDRAMMTYTLARVYEAAGDRKRALDFARQARKDIIATEALADYRESIDAIIPRLGGGRPPHASSSSASSSPHR